MKRVFILGAGSNKFLTFPTGYELRKDILTHPIEMLDPSDVTLTRKFKHEFNFSQNISIDRFIEQNRRYEDIGKRIIAKKISEAEVRAKNLLETEELSSKSEIVDNWHRYIFNRVQSGLNNVNVLKEENIFITFNYDRSLENFILNAIDNSYITRDDGDCDPEELRQLYQQKINLLNRFEFRYVYGQIGYLKDSPFGKSYQFRDIEKIANTIKLISKDRKSIPGQDIIKNHIKSADLIYVIGFGFDQINMDIIGLTSKELKAQAIFATCKNIGLAERISILNRFAGSMRKNLRFYNHKGTIEEFVKDLYLDSVSADELSTIMNFRLHLEEMQTVKVFQR